MFLRQILTFVLLGCFGIVVSAQEPPPAADRKVPERVDLPRDEVPDLPNADKERQRARAEFIEARRAFNELVTATLTSEEMTREVQDISLRLSLRKAENRLDEVRLRLLEVEQAGRADTDEADRLRQREASLTVEVQSLRNPDPRTQQAGVATAAGPVLAGTLRKRWSEETEYLADVLDNAELRNSTRRLRRLMALANLVGGLRELRQQERDNVEIDVIIPASGTKPQQQAPGAEKSDDSKPATDKSSTEKPAAETDDSLGEPTTVPPSDQQ